MGDGQPERMNRTLINMLKCLSAEEKNNWNNHLSKLAFAYNCMVNKSTSFSPFYLMFGRQPRLPIDWIFDIDVGKENIQNYADFVRSWEKAMKQAVHIARKHIDVGKKWNTETYNKKVKGSPVKVGDKILLRNYSKGGTGKLRSYWEDVVYEVEDVDSKIPVLTIRNGKKTKRIHRNNVMLCNDLVKERIPGMNERKQKQPKKKQLRSNSKKLGQICEDRSIDRSSSSSESEFLVTPQLCGGEGIEYENSSTEEAAMVEKAVEPVVYLENVSSSDESEVEEPVGDLVEVLEGNEVVNELQDVSVLDGDASSIGEDITQSENASGDDSSSDSNSSRDSDAQTTPPRKSSSVKRAPKVYTYDTIGGNPVFGDR